MGKDLSPFKGNTEITLGKKSETWYYCLSKEEQIALISAQMSTQSLNEYLSGRGDFNEATKAKLDKQAKDIDSALSKFTTDKEITVYRGVSADEFTKIYLGLDTTTKGVKSTSYDEGRAGAFANGQGGYVIEYHVKPGNHGADVNGVPGANEREFLVRNGMKQKVIAKPDKKKLIVEIW